MKKLLLIAGVIGFIALQGCDNEKKKESTTDVNTTEQSQNQPEIVNSDSGIQTIVSQPAEITTVQPSNPATQITAPQITAPQVATPPGMNPPHGAPGHDCAIAVGAPLKK